MTSKLLIALWFCAFLAIFSTPVLAQTYSWGLVCSPAEGKCKGTQVLVCLNDQNQQEAEDENSCTDERPQTGPCQVSCPNGKCDDATEECEACDGGAFGEDCAYTYTHTWTACALRPPSDTTPVCSGDNGSQTSTVICKKSGDVVDTTECENQTGAPETSRFCTVSNDCASGSACNASHTCDCAIGTWGRRCAWSWEDQTPGQCQQKDSDSTSVRCGSTAGSQTTPRVCKNAFNEPGTPECVGADSTVSDCDPNTCQNASMCAANRLSCTCADPTTQGGTYCQFIKTFSPWGTCTGTAPGGAQCGTVVNGGQQTRTITCSSGNPKDCESFGELATTRNCDLQVGSCPAGRTCQPDNTCSAPPQGFNIQSITLTAPTASANHYILEQGKTYQLSVIFSGDTPQGDESLTLNLKSNVSGQAVIPLSTFTPSQVTGGLTVAIVIPPANIYNSAFLTASKLDLTIKEDEYGIDYALEYQILTKFTWQSGMWGDCPGECGTSTRTRAVVCQQSRTGAATVSTDTFPLVTTVSTGCDEGSKPIASDPCTNSGVCLAAGGTCNPTTNLCVCNENYTGTFCDTPVSSTDPCSSAALCANGGVRPSLPPMLGGGCSPFCACTNSWVSAPATPAPPTSALQGCTVCSIECSHPNFKATIPTGIHNPECTGCQCQPGMYGDRCSCRQLLFTFPLYNPPAFLFETPGANLATTILPSSPQSAWFTQFVVAMATVSGIQLDYLIPAMWFAIPAASENSPSQVHFTFIVKMPCGELDMTPTYLGLSTFLKMIQNQQLHSTFSTAFGLTTTQSGVTFPITDPKLTYGLAIYDPTCALVTPNIECPPSASNPFAGPSSTAEPEPIVITPKEYDNVKWNGAFDYQLQAFFSFLLAITVIAIF